MNTSRSNLAIAAVVALAVAHLVGVVTSFDDAARLRWVHDLTGWAGSLIGVIGTAVAARAFTQGDWLRRVWTLFTVGSTMLLLGTALRSYWTHAAPNEPFLTSPLLPVRMVVVVLANVTSVWALVSLALTYHKSGLTPPQTWVSWTRWGVTAAAALAVAVPQYALDFKRLGDSVPDTWSAITNIASTVGDMMTVLLIAPILRVAYMLRGGKLAWVWWAMAVSGAVWLVYDSKEWLAVLLPGDDAHNLELLRVLRSPGLALVGLAGFLQRDAVASTAR
ncbi:MAG: hypothetical protein ACOZQL_14530 [Myxococcota bacterium]